MSNFIGVFEATLLVGSSFLAYSNGNYNYNLSSLIFWSIGSVIYFLHLWKIFLGGAITCYAFLVYLKYQFLEINELIENSLKNKNTNLLLNAIIRHKSIKQTVHKLNKMYKIMVFLVYLAFAPGIDLSICMTLRKDSEDIMKIISVSVGKVCFSVMFTLNYMCAQIIKTAHKSPPLLYRFLIENKLSVHQKLKIVIFIEHLSGNEIGLYCLDLFPMNNFVVFYFTVEVIMKYFLLIKLL